MSEPAHKVSRRGLVPVHARDAPPPASGMGPAEDVAAGPRFHGPAAAHSPMLRSPDLTGLQFGEWTVIRRLPRPAGQPRSQWECRCSCGTIRKLPGSRLVKSDTRSCGCKILEHKAATERGKAAAYEQLVADAESWRALMACRRMSIGGAGLGEPISNYARVGVDFSTGEISPSPNQHPEWFDRFMEIARANFRRNWR